MPSARSQARRDGALVKWHLLEPVVSDLRDSQLLDSTGLANLLPTSAWPTRIRPGKILVHSLTRGLQGGLGIGPNSPIK
uniref:Uncharacterized protein n=1 Tax=Cannabis sativa TaxID=3483 RepID=A0A803Q6J3_CANSA